MTTRGITFKHGFNLAEGNLFETREFNLPPLTTTDLLVKVAAVSVNPVDTKLRANKKTPAGTILGYDAVGTVLKVGTAVKDFKIGDRVMYAGTTTRAGSYSEKQLVDCRIAAKAPVTPPLKDVAGLPLTFLTAYEVLFEKIGLIPEKNANTGTKILIINGAGGVGSAAIQLAKWAGLMVITTASRPATRDWTEKLGADFVINHHQNLTQQLADLKITSLPAILILHSTDAYFKEAASLVQAFGHVASIVETSRPHQLNLLKGKAASWDWEYMFAKTDYDFKIETQGAILAKISQLIEEKQFVPTTTKVLSGLTPQTLFNAHQIVESDKMIGKLVIEY